MAFLRLLCLLLLVSFVFGEDQCSLLCASGVCCENPSGGLLCCPSVNGVCCDSGNFCCPQGTKCESDGSCTRIQSGFFGLINYYTPSPPQPSIPTQPPLTTLETKVKINLDTCPSVCGDSCCPHVKGVCCDDNKHCCPSGYECDISTKSCRLSPLEMTVESVDDRTCPLNDSGCPSSYTCCLMFDGSKGCCPYEHADCCADGFHCCPRGTRCRSDSGGCVPVLGAWMNPYDPVNRLVNRRLTIKCPDGKSGCPGHSTCCMTSKGYACCPLNDAVCCSDGEHCCPKGHLCDPSNGGSCILQSSNSVISLPSESVVQPIGNRVKCDATTYCEGPNVTCCKLVGGVWGCCPFSEAVCCNDLEHCCPNGYICDPSRKCVISGRSGNLSHPWGFKTLAKSSVYIKCGDGKSSCPDGETCCPSGWNSYSCCPMPNAVCCEDNEHCCPHGYRCDISRSECIHNENDSLVVPMNKKFNRASRFLPLN